MYMQELTALLFKYSFVHFFDKDRCMSDNPAGITNCSTVTLQGWDIFASISKLCRSGLTGVRGATASCHSLSAVAATSCRRFTARGHLATVLECFAEDGGDLIPALAACIEHNPFTAWVCASHSCLISVYLVFSEP